MAQDESKQAIALPVISTPGSRPLRNRVWERYCRYRAQCLPHIEAWKLAARTAFRGPSRQISDKGANDWSKALERKPQIAQRISYLSNDEADLIRAKRQRLEERLWSMHECDIGDAFDSEGKLKSIHELDPEFRKNIEKISISANGKYVPQLYSKQVASVELRKMLNIGRNDDNQVNRLSDAELVAQLSDMANQLGVKIDLSYSFVGDQPDEQPSDSEPDQDIAK